MLWETQLGNPVTPNKSQIPIFPKEPHSRAQQRAMRHSFFIYIFVCISFAVFIFHLLLCIGLLQPFSIPIFSSKNLYQSFSFFDALIFLHNLLVLPYLYNVENH